VVRSGSGSAVVVVVVVVVVVRRLTLSHLAVRSVAIL
jgi:hypothetical protein